MPELTLSLAARLKRLVPLCTLFVLLSIVFGVVAAIRPNEILKTSHDLQRRSDLQNLVTALHSFYMQNSMFPDSVPVSGTGVEVCRNAGTPRPCIDLQPMVGSILNRIPADPIAPEERTYYFLHVTPQGRLMGNTLGQPPIPLLSVVQ
jgi:hypothetical protein